MALDQLIQRLQNLEPFNIYAIKDGIPEPWYEVTGAIVRDLVIMDQDLVTQVQSVSGQVAHWSRMAAQCKRVWEIEERLYRSWRSRFYLEKRNSDTKHTEKEIEALYRSDGMYTRLQSNIERAEEAYESSRGIVAAFQAKREMIRAAIWRDRETGQPTLSV